MGPALLVSDYFDIELTQPYLDFVDVDSTSDAKLYLDPTALLTLNSSWASECVALIQDFFQRVVNHLANGNRDAACDLMEVLREPNETHLGVSVGKSRGRGLGRFKTYDIVDALETSGALDTGLLQDLEDTILMVEGVGPDIVSDIATNIIRVALIQYTQEMAEAYSIPLIPGVDSGSLWDPSQGRWFNELTHLPMTSAGKLLLVPKAIVRRRLAYSYDNYYWHFILPYLQDAEIQSKSSLVRVLKSGEHRVSKNDLVDKYGRGKRFVVEQTKQHPEILQKYREQKRGHPEGALSHAELAGDSHSALPNWPELLAALSDIPPGSGMASQYHLAIMKILSALFYPCLVTPRKEREINEGRKRIDIVFVNAATDGFFQWVSKHYPAPNILVECKNYSADPANPELDQLSGRFSPSRGKIGLLMCRNFEDKELFIQRCRDTANDQQGFIVPLDDDDLRSLVEAGAEYGYESRQFQLLNERFNRLIM